MTSSDSRPGHSVPGLMHHLDPFQAHHCYSLRTAARMVAFSVSVATLEVK